MPLLVLGNVALAKYLANALFGPNYFITAVFFYIRPIIKIAVMKYFGLIVALAKYLESFKKLQ